MRRDGGSVFPAHANTGTLLAQRGLSANEIARALISMVARSTTRSNQRPDTLMQDRIRQIDETSCDARPDHTCGSNPVLRRYPRHFRLATGNANSRSLSKRWRLARKSKRRLSSVCDPKTHCAALQCSSAGSNSTPAAAKPPSTLSTWPVMWPASVDARNAAAAAMSAGCAYCFKAMRERKASRWRGP